MEKNGFVLLTETEYKQLNLPASYGSFEQLYNYMTNDLKKNNHLLKKIGLANTLSDEEKQISFLNNYFVFKKIRNVNDVDDLLENSELQEQEARDNDINEFDELDKELEVKQATKLSEKSKKLAEKYLLENQDYDKDKDKEKDKEKEKDLENRMEKSLPDIANPNAIVSDKIKLVEHKKKLKLEEKLKAQQEKKTLKEEEKIKAKLEKKTMKEEEKKMKKLEAKA